MLQSQGLDPRPHKFLAVPCKVPAPVFTGNRRKDLIDLSLRQHEEIGMTVALRYPHEHPWGSRLLRNFGSDYPFVIGRCGLYLNLDNTLVRVREGDYIGPFRVTIGDRCRNPTPL